MKLTVKEQKKYTILLYLKKYMTRLGLGHSTLLYFLKKQGMPANIKVSKLLLEFPFFSEKV